jgi:hypothetical protein
LTKEVKVLADSHIKHRARKTGNVGRPHFPDSKDFCGIHDLSNIHENTFHDLSNIHENTSSSKSLKPPTLRGKLIDLDFDPAGNAAAQELRTCFSTSSKLPPPKAAQSDGSLELA